MTTLLLMRHGHVEGIAPERFRGRAELPLSALGQEQAEALAGRLARRGKPVALYTSPLGRCVQTALPITRALGVAGQPLEGLHDIDYGQWQGKAHEDVRRDAADLYRLWFERPHLMRFPGGESLQDLVARTADGLRDVLARHPRGEVFLVGHDSVNRALLLQLLDQPLSAYWTLAQSPCCINEIEIGPRGIQVVRINDTAHLEGLRPK
ncbi:histidine phosphatase family protein [Achromobacter aloeverae]